MRAIEKDTREASGSDSRSLSPKEPNNPVLCVDLDGTLLKTDLLWECVTALLKVRPSALLMVPVWFVRGKATLKQRLAERADLDVTALPYREELVAFIGTQRKTGMRTVLATAADSSLAEKVAIHLGIFDEVHATQAGRNLKGKQKALLLQREFADTGFDYVGNSRTDLPVWKAARAGYVVGDRALVRRAASVVKIAGVFESQSASLVSWVRAFRGHHWTKNLLLFLPLLLAHKRDLRLFLTTAAAFLLFSFCASSVYILNDLLDLHSDRAHPWKAKRPFASGETSISAGLLISTVLIAATIALGFLLKLSFAATLIVYVLATMWYSIQLKRLPLIDVFVLSSFYSMRIWAGALTTATPLSDWFLAFSLFFFLSLAMAKRYSELMHAGQLVRSGNSGRGYEERDRELFMHLGVASSFAAVVILSLYVQSKDVTTLYRRPESLLLICPVILYWLSRLWLQANRGELDEDPVALAAGDPVSYAVAAVIFVLLLISGPVV